MVQIVQWWFLMILSDRTCTITAWEIILSWTVAHLKDHDWKEQQNSKVCRVLGKLLSKTMQCVQQTLFPQSFTHIFGSDLFEEVWGGANPLFLPNLQIFCFQQVGVSQKCQRHPSKSLSFSKRNCSRFDEDVLPGTWSRRKDSRLVKWKKAAVMRSHQVFTKCLSMDRLHRLHLTSFCQDEMDQIPKEQGLVSAKFWQFRGTKVTHNPTVAPGSVDFLQLSGQIHWELHIPAGSQEKSPDYWIHITDYHNKDLI